MADIPYTGQVLQALGPQPAAPTDYASMVAEALRQRQLTTMPPMSGLSSVVAPPPASSMGAALDGLNAPPPSPAAAPGAAPAAPAVPDGPVTPASLAAATAAPGEGASSHGVQGVGSIPVPSGGSGIDMNGVPAISLASRGGAVTVPSREMDLLGPRAKSALEEAHAQRATAVNDIRGLGVQSAMDEQAMYREHARRAIDQQSAIDEETAKRNQELQSRAFDFDDAVRDAARQGKVDPDHLWNSASTGEKIGMFIAVALGGLAAAQNGGSNAVWGMIDKAMDQDIRAQEFAYNAARDKTAAANTAYGMAMQRWGSPDAAKAFARAVGQDQMQAEIQRQAALNKGTQVEANAMAALPEIADKRAQETVAGTKFIPEQQVQAGPRYSIRGRVGTFSEKEVQGFQEKEEGRGFELEKIDREQAGKHLGERDKATKDRDARWVPTSSTGQGYYAPTEKEGTDHREMQASTQEVLDLVDKIEKTNKKLGYSGRVLRLIPGSPDTADAKAVKGDSVALVGALNRSQKFGALDKGTQELLQEMTGDPLAIMGNEAKLEAIRRNAIERRRQYERSATGSKPSLAPEGSTGGTGKPQAW